MARKKSWLRQRLNSRWLLWTAMRGTGRLAPAVTRSLNFPMRSVLAVDVAESVIEDRREREGEAFTPRERDLVLVPAQTFDTGRDLTNSEGSTTMIRQAATLRGCSVLGHTFTILDRNGDAVSLLPWTPNWNYARPAMLTRRRLADTPHVCLMGARHYYHSFANDFLPLWDYLERLHPPGEPLSVIVPPRPTPAQAASRAVVRAGFPQVSFVELGPGERAELAELRWVFQLGLNQEWLPVPGDTVRRFAGAMRAQYALPADPRRQRRLFVSRGENAIRRMLGEDEVWRRLERLGFERFVPEAGDHRAQVERFGDAELIVAVHGAALTNLIFAQPGASLVEIFPANFVKSTFLWLSRRMGLRYVPVIAGPGDYDQTFSVDPSAVEEAVRLVLLSTGEGRLPNEPRGTTPRTGDPRSAKEWR
jgi:hypothetical protein